MPLIASCLWITSFIVNQSRISRSVCCVMCVKIIKYIIVFQKTYYSYTTIYIKIWDSCWITFLLVTTFQIEQVAASLVDIYFIILWILCMMLQFCFICWDSTMLLFTYIVPGESKKVNKVVLSKANEAYCFLMSSKWTKHPEVDLIFDGKHSACSKPDRSLNISPCLWHRCYRWSYWSI